MARRRRRRPLAGPLDRAHRQRPRPRPHIPDPNHPGDHATYLAPGFYADIDGGYVQHWAINTRTLDEAKRRAVEDVLR